MDYLSSLGRVLLIAAAALIAFPSRVSPSEKCEIPLAVLAQLEAERDRAQRDFEEELLSRGTPPAEAKARAEALANLAHEVDKLEARKRATQEERRRSSSSPSEKPPSSNGSNGSGTRR